MRQETADLVIAELDEWGWVQGAGLAPDGRVCLQTAMQQVLRKEHGQNVPVRRDQYFRDQEDVLAQVGVLFPDRDKTSIPRFNDDLRTTLEDVKLAVKSAVTE